MYHCDKCNAVKHNVVNGLKVVQSYSWLLDSFVLDYYTDKHWEKLPIRWQQILEDVEPQELGRLLDQENLYKSFQRVWPLSLLALRSTSHYLSVPRQQCWQSDSHPEQCQHCTRAHCQQDKATAKEHLPAVSRLSCCLVSRDEEAAECVPVVSEGFSCHPHQCWHCRDNVNVQTMLQNESLPLVQQPPVSLRTHSKLSHVFTKHVKPKKRHEIVKMAQVAAETARVTGCQVVVDVGSGLGHLARTLAYGHGLRVCCLEAQDVLAEQAKKLDLELEVSLSKHLPTNETAKLHRPVHLRTTLTLQTHHAEFLKALQAAFGDMDKCIMKFGIVGLHPCGDLAPILMRLFADCANAQFINIVGCCYMKLSTDTSQFKGYPLSEFVSERHHALSYEAREIACHAIENYCQRLYSGDIDHLKVHCYRATLERIIVKHWPELRHSGIRSIKHTSHMTFQEYCTAATSRLGVEVPHEELNCTETLDNLVHWKRVVTFYTLRLLLAPVVETVLLLDRLLFLRELGLTSNLLPVFDPNLSPRNHILIATKPQQILN